MVDVKDDLENPSPPAVQLLAATLDVVRETFQGEDWGGLRPSHFRLLAAVPADGINVTELAARLGMTKQGCGQFVTALTASGHLRVTPQTHDRRVRLVTRTTRGDQTARAVDDRIARIEQDWISRVGTRRYATFRRVMEEITAAGEEAAEVSS